MAKKRVKEEQSTCAEQSGSLSHIWRYLSTPENMCYRDCFLKLDKEFGAFGAYLLEGNSAPCEYGDGTCFCLVTNKNEKSATIKCGALDRDVPNCKVRRVRERLKKKFPLSLIKMYRLDQGLALYDLAEKMGITANCPQPRVGQHTFLLGFINLSSKKTMDVYIACSTDRKMIHKDADEIIVDADDKFVLLVPNESLVSPKTVDLLKKEGYGSFVVGMDSILQLHPQANLPCDATVLKNLEKLAGIEIVQPLTDVVKVKLGQKRGIEVDPRTIKRLENDEKIKEAALNLIPELAKNKRLFGRCFTAEGKPRAKYVAPELAKRYAKKEGYPTIFTQPLEMPLGERSLCDLVSKACKEQQKKLAAKEPDNEAQ